MRFDRRAMLGGLIAGGVLPMIQSASGNAGVADVERYPSPIEITADDIAWFRECRSAWIESESGAPAVIPARLSLQEAADALDDDPRMADLLGRLERTLCAFCVHGRFAPGRYALAPPVPPSEGFPSARELTEFDVSTDHIRLLQRTDWRGSIINPKRPYGGASYCEIDVARIVGIPLPPLRDGEDLPAELHAPLTALHHDLLFVLQAFLQHTELVPGRYRIPFNGWDHLRPRCQPATQARIDAYVQAWERLRRQTFPDRPAMVVPVMQASDVLFRLD
jgi:hypothetical protein